MTSQHKINIDTLGVEALDVNWNQIFVKITRSQNLILFNWVNLSELHSNVENGTVVHARRTMETNRIATYYYSLVRLFMYKQTR